MQNLVISTPPPSMDSYAPEFCFCGKKTVESHEFLFCSTKCARSDSLRSLDDRECHYRNVVRTAYVQAGVPELSPRRMMSADHLRAGALQQRGFTNAPPYFPPPMDPPPQRNAVLARRDALDWNMTGFPPPSQLTRNGLVNTEAREPAVTVGQGRSRWPEPAPSRGHLVQRSQDRTVEQISLDSIPFPDHCPPRPLRRVPQMNASGKGNLGKSVAALLKAGISKRGKGDENPETVFGHPVSTVVPPTMKASLPSHHRNYTPSAMPVQGSKALRRSASFAGWNTTSNARERDTVMHVIDELREEVSGSFDPRSLFDLEELY